MSRILKYEPFDAPVQHFGSDVWHIADERCSNSAVKFWSALIDEALCDYPLTTSCLVSASGETVYDRKLLFPELSLRAQDLRPGQGGLGAVLKHALNEISVYGPPAPVSVKLLAGDNILAQSMFPLDCMDAETVPFLVAWLFEWSSVPERDWNQSSFSGAFNAFDLARRFCYEIKWSFSRADLSEGLYNFELHLNFCRKGT